jgi:hypothetical protein
VKSGPKIFGGAGALTFTGQVGTVKTGGNLGGAGALTWTGGAGRLVNGVRGGAGSLTWTGQAGRVGAQYADDFNRANSTTTLGSNWTTRFATMGINANGAYGVGTVEPFATYNKAMIYDDMRVSIVAGAESVVGTSHRLYIVLGANTTGECVVLDLDSGGGFSIMTKNTWAGGLNSRAARFGQTIVVGDTYALERVGNVYTATHNGGPIGSGLSWTDNFTVQPRDASHRLVGIGALNGANYQRIDSWSAENI